MTRFASLTNVTQTYSEDDHAAQIVDIEDKVVSSHSGLVRAVSRLYVLCLTACDAMMFIASFRFHVYAIFAGYPQDRYRLLVLASGCCPRTTTSVRPRSMSADSDLEILGRDSLAFA